MKGGLRALVVGADAERLGRLAGHLVGRADGVSLELLASGEAAADRLSTPDVDCIAYEVTLDVPPPEGFERSLREAARSVPVVLFGEDGPALDSRLSEATVVRTLLVAYVLAGVIVIVPALFLGAARRHAEPRRRTPTAPGWRAPAPARSGGDGSSPGPSGVRPTGRPSVRR